MAEAIATYFVNHRNRLPSNVYDFSENFLQYLPERTRETVVGRLMQEYANDGEILRIIDMTKALALDPNREILLTALGKAIEKEDVIRASTAMDIIRERYKMEISKKFEIAYDHIDSLKETGDINISRPRDYVKQLLTL